VNLTKIELLKKNVRENLQKIKESAEKYYDEKIKLLVLNPGQYIYYMK